MKQLALLTQAVLIISNAYSSKYKGLIRKKRKVCCKRWAVQLQFVFTWKAKILINWKQLVNDRKQNNSYHYDAIKKVWVKTKLSEKIQRAFASYRSWKDIFQKTGEVTYMPDWVYMY